jgi:hypothetical protein
MCNLLWRPVQTLETSTSLGFKEIFLPLLNTVLIALPEMNHRR